MKIAVVKERAEGETRVSLTAEVARRLVDAGHTVSVERGAGLLAGVADAAYETAGAVLHDDAESTLDGADVVPRVGVPAAEEVLRLPEGCCVISFVYPDQNPELVRALAARRVTAFAMDRVPRITRAQAMDALSSMGTVAGYRAALLAAQHLGKFFPMLMTAAGTVPPARIVVLGVGVAGLQAIATCRRLGAVVEAYDIRAEAREQAASLGAEVIEVDVGEKGEGEGGYARKLSDEAEKKLAALLAKRIQRADGVITTALVPGKPAPKLVSAETIGGMKPGSVIIDLAAETGGNCAGTKSGDVCRVGGVTIVGPLNLSATMPIDASRMYAKNVQEIVTLLSGEGGVLHLDFEDEIVDGAVVVHDGRPRTSGERAATAAQEEGSAS